MSTDAYLLLGKLRPIKPTELEMMLCWRNAPSTRANMYTRHTIGEAEHLAWWEQVRKRSDKRYLMYEFQHEPKGVVAFNDIDPSHRSCSWAFYTAPDAGSGTGVGMEFLALEHAFRQLRLNKLYCEVLAFNTPVISLHKKFGFVVEGVFRSEHAYNETFIDIYRLGILAGEWEEKREYIQTKILPVLKRLTRISPIID